MSVVDSLTVLRGESNLSAALNMAVDDALVARAGAPILRFYGWHSPAVSFGYFSKFEDVRALMPERELVRRSTGGGIVLHGEDLTYSFILPRSHPLYSRRPLEIYTALHDAMRRACIAHGLRATLAAQPAPRISDACFANPVAADLLIDGRKVAGAAQRKSRAGLLHQGSIQIANLPAEFETTFASEVCSDYVLAGLDADTIAAAARIAERKYATDQWTRRR